MGWLAYGRAFTLVPCRDAEVCQEARDDCCCAFSLVVCRDAGVGQEVFKVRARGWRIFDLEDSFAPRSFFRSGQVWLRETDSVDEGEAIVWNCILVLVYHYEVGGKLMKAWGKGSAARLSATCTLVVFIAPLTRPSVPLWTPATVNASLRSQRRRRLTLRAPILTWSTASRNHEGGSPMRGGAPPSSLSLLVAWEDCLKDAQRGALPVRDQSLGSDLSPSLSKRTEGEEEFAAPLQVQLRSAACHCDELLGSCVGVLHPRSASMSHLKQPTNQPPPTSRSGSG